MALLDDEELLPFFGNPNIQRQGARARALAAQRDVNTLPDPRTYAAVSGLLGTAPDQMGFSVLNPQYESIQRTAKPAFALGTLLGLAPMTKGLPVGASIKDVGKVPFLKPTEYRGSHRAPGPDFGAPLYDLTGGGQMYPADVYSAKAAQYYGTGYPKADREAFALAQRVRGNPDAEITMYRAVPKDEKITNINAGDWVSLSKDYAKTHGESVLQGNYKILSQKVKAKDLWTNADSIHEFGYQPQNKTSKFPAPQQAALDLAQQRAALPVEQGGLGLPAGNTAAQRAKAMGGKEMVHFSRAGGDYTTLDSGKFAIAPFDAVGTHVGTPQAAMERFQNTTGYKVNNPNYANDELKGVTYPVTILGDRPLMNQNGMPFGEDDLSALLRQQGGHNWSDLQGGKMTYQDMNANLRKKLFEDQGYTSIPYFNEVEGKGSISYIVPPENIRSRFAAFDPFRRSAAVAAAMGVAAPDLLAAQQDEEMRKLQQLGLLGMVAP